MVTETPTGACCNRLGGGARKTKRIELVGLPAEIDLRTALRGTIAIGRRVFQRDNVQLIMLLSRSIH